MSVEIVSWSSGTDEQIAAMLDAAAAGEIDLQQDGGWAVGDTRTISISSFKGRQGTFPAMPDGGRVVTNAAENIDIVITSFDEYMNCGNLLQFDFKESVTSQFCMNVTTSTVGGYGESLIYRQTLPALAEALPQWMQSRLKTFSVLASKENADTGTIILETIGWNKLALRSIAEIFENPTGANPDEGMQLPYYASNENQIKHRGINGDPCIYWTRSYSISNPTYDFGVVNIDYLTDGQIAKEDYVQVHNNCGIAPFGCLGGYTSTPTTPDIVPFSKGTDKQIAALIDAATLGEIDLQQDAGWNVGDARLIDIPSYKVNDNYTCPDQQQIIEISSFGEYMNCGNVLQFDFKTVTYSTSYSDSSPATGGYGESNLYKHCGSLSQHMPEWITMRLRVFPVECAKYSSYSSYSIERVENNRLAIRSEWEIFGTGPEEGQRISYYNTQANRVKTGLSGEVTSAWLTRTLNYDRTTAAHVSSDGSSCVYGIVTGGGYRFTPFGCLGGIAIRKPEITRNPQSVTVNDGNTATFSVTASGDSITYQWQVSTNNGVSWTNISGATNDSYSVIASINMNGYQYTCVVSNTAGDVRSDAAALTVNSGSSVLPPYVTSHPKSQTVTSGRSVTFYVSATGDNLEYQWQTAQSGAWVNISGKTSNSITVNASTADNGRQYRCQVSNAAGTVYSNAATLTVQAQPTPTPPTPPRPVVPGLRLIINGVDITRYVRYQGFKWSRNDVDGPNAGRNIIAEMVRDRVATKIRIDITCVPLTKAEHNMIMNLIMPEFVTVQYDDPVYGFTTKTMYANNNDSEYCIRKPNGIEYWNNVSFPLIEK